MRAVSVTLEMVVDSNSPEEDLNRQIQRYLGKQLESTVIENSTKSGFTTVLCADVMDVHSEEI